MTTQPRQLAARQRFAHPDIASRFHRPRPGGRRQRCHVQRAPFAQVSSAEQLRVSVAMGLAMNPKPRVLLVRGASLLDDDGRAMIAKMAEDADAQLWLEVVGDGAEVSVVIEDGAVRAPREPVGDTPTSAVAPGPVAASAPTDDEQADAVAAVFTADGGRR